MVANQELFDAALRHQVQIRRLATGEVRAILEILEKADAELTAMLRDRLVRLAGRPLDLSARRTRLLLQQIRSLRRTAMAEIRDRLRGDLVELAKVEADFEARMVQASFPVELDLAAVPVATLRAAVTTQPFAGGPNAARTLGQWFNSLERADQRRTIEAVQLGLAQGETIDDMVRRVAGTRARGYRDGVLAITRRNAEAVVRTAVNHVSNAARESVHAANAAVIQALRWTSTLDGRTTLGCAERDGEFTPIGDSELPKGVPRLEPPGARPPRHPQCRSVMVPVLNVEGVAAQLGDRPFVRDTRTRRRREIDFRARAKANAGNNWRGMPERDRRRLIREERLAWTQRNVGQVPGKTTYQEWLGRQSAEFQDSVLGPTRGRLFRRGDLTLDRFVDNTGQRLTLAELRRRDPKAFLDAGIDERGKLPPSYSELARSRTGERTRRLTARDIPAPDRIRQIGGGPIRATSRERLESIRRVLRQGQGQVDAVFGNSRISLAVKADGTFEIIDGRHRVLALQEFPEIEMLVRFVQGA